MAWVYIIVGLLFVGFALYLLMFPGKKSDVDPNSKLKQIQEKHSPEQTRFEARKEAKAATARTEELKAINAETVQLIETINQEKNLEATQFIKKHYPAKQTRDEEMEISNHQVLLAQNELTTHLIGGAKEKDLDMPSYVEWQKKLLMDRADLDKQWAEAEQQLKAGFIFQLQAHQHLALMTEYIGKLYDRAEELQAKGKNRELNLIEEHISFMEGDFRERQRLLQAANGKEIQGSDEGSNASGNSGAAMEAEQLEIPAKRGRGRPKGSPNK